METTSKSLTKFTLPSDQEVRLTRVFDAPSKLVFEAFTNPKHVPNWMSAMGSPMTGCEIDLRVGGSYRHVWTKPEGGEMAFRGVFKEVNPYDRLVHTEIFEDYPSEESIVTSTFDEKDGKTTYTATVKYSSKEVRDMVLSTGMEEGWGETIDNLAAYLPTIA